MEKIIVFLLTIILILPFFSVASQFPTTVYLERASTHDLYIDDKMTTHLVITSPRYFDGINWKPVNLTFENKSGNLVMPQNIYNTVIFPNDTISLSYKGLNLAFKPNFFLLENSSGINSLDLKKSLTFSGNSITWVINSSEVNATVSYRFEAERIFNVVQIDNSTIEDKEEGAKLLYEEEFSKGLDNYLEQDSYFYKGNEPLIKLESPIVFGKNNTVISQLAWERKPNKFQAKLDKNLINKTKYPLTIDPDLTIDGVTYQASGDLTLGILAIQNNGTLQIIAYNGTASSGYINITASNITIADGSKIDGVSRGYRGGVGDGGGAGYDAAADGEGPGQPISYVDCSGSVAGGSGAGYGSRGGAGAGTVALSGGDTYGTNNGLDIERGSGSNGACGSGGGGTGAAATNGGAMVVLNASIINVQGLINMSSNTASNTVASTGSAGSGGGILLYGEVVNTTYGILQAHAGSPGPDGGGRCSAGSAGGGRIKVFFSRQFHNTSMTTNVAGTDSGGTGCGGVNAEGTVAGTYFAGMYNSRPTVREGMHIPLSTAQYNFSRTYTFNATIDDQNNQTDLSVILLERNFTASFVNSTVTTCATLNDTARNCSISNSNLGKGRYQLRFLANDTQNAFGNSTPSYYVILDQISPNVTNITTNPLSITAGNSITILANISDDNSTIGTVHTRIQAPSGSAINYTMSNSRTVQSFYPLTYEYTATIASQDITEIGSYTVRIFANDSENNLNQLSTLTTTFAVNPVTGGGTGGGAGGGINITIINITNITLSTNLAVLPSTWFIVPLFTTASVRQDFIVSNIGSETINVTTALYGENWCKVIYLGNEQKPLFVPSSTDIPLPIVTIEPAVSAYSIVECTVPPNLFGNATYENKTYEIGLVFRDINNPQGKVAFIKVGGDIISSFIQTLQFKATTKLITNPEFTTISKCGSDICIPFPTKVTLGWFGLGLILAIPIIVFAVANFILPVKDINLRGKMQALLALVAFSGLIVLI